MLLGAAVLAVALPAALYWLEFNQSAPAHVVAAAPASQPHRFDGSWTRKLFIQRADFGVESASPQVRRMANWVMVSGDHGNRSFLVIDKTAAKIFVFNPAGKLQATAPALLGEALGDDSAPGIGDKPLAQVLPEEKTTPAGRFVAEVGMSTRGEDVVWVDYDAAVSMHRVLKIEQRLTRLDSPTPDDNRMSFGCINVPPQFYEQVLRPTADRGAIIYILPETRPLSATFAGFYEVDSPIRLVRTAP